MPIGTHQDDAVRQPSVPSGQFLPVGAMDGCANVHAVHRQAAKPLARTRGKPGACLAMPAEAREQEMPVADQVMRSGVRAGSFLQPEVRQAPPGVNDCATSSTELVAIGAPRGIASLSQTAAPRYT